MKNNHSGGRGFGPLSIWLAGLCVVGVPVQSLGQDAQLAAEPFSQQGSKLVGSLPSGNATQGWSVALSADGNTAIVGGVADNRVTGAAWVYTRSGVTSTQQGGKLVGTGVIGIMGVGEGFSVALSHDGNTAIVGGPYDNTNAGASWVFTRSGNGWTQQGNKLVGTGAVGNAEQGWSVALSADGNTAIVGGLADNGVTGAAWIFTRSGSVWTQQGTKLVGRETVGPARQGYSVTLSADGNTAIVGGPHDNGKAGAAWVFTRSGSIWSQSGPKLIGTGTVGNAEQGSSVALSADGSIAIVGGTTDDAEAGAACVFTRNGAAWVQQGYKLVGTGAVGPARQGRSVALSADGRTAMVGGLGDDGMTGAAWVFTRNGNVWTTPAERIGF